MSPAHHSTVRSECLLLNCRVHSWRSVFKVALFSISFVCPVQKHRLAFWQRAVLTVPVKSRRLAVTNHKMKL